MEQNTKNFDRNIEKMMNEHEVAPPFGMWNRISSELEAIPAAVAAAGPPVATALIPKRALAGIIAAVFVIGATMATDYVVNRNHKTQIANVAATAPLATTKRINKVAVTEQTIPVKNITAIPAETALNKAKAKAVAANPMQAAIQAAKQVQPAVSQPVAVNTTTESPSMINENAEVPTPVQPVAKSGIEQQSQSYYFPPIDGNTQAREENSLAAAKARINDLVPYTGDERPKVSNSRGKFHPKKRQKFQYGNIIH